MLESVTVDVPADLYFDDWNFRHEPPELLRNGARVRPRESGALRADARWALVTQQR